MLFDDPTPRDFGLLPPSDGPVICEPVPVRESMTCRRGTGVRSTFQGQPVPKCEGILKPFSDPLVHMIENSFQCDKCGLMHATVPVDGQLRYGALL